MELATGAIKATELLLHCVCSWVFIQKVRIQKGSKCLQCSCKRKL